MSSTTRDVRSHAFRIDDPDEPARVVRGVVEAPPDTKDGETRPYVLVLHGFKGFMDWGFFPELARRLVACGLTVVRFNRSGSGIGEDPLEISEAEAFERNTPSREVEDTARVRAWIDAGKLPWVDARHGGIFGHSIGGAVALLHAARAGDYRAVVVWAPSARFDRYDDETVAAWRERGYMEIPNARTNQVHRLGYGWLEDVRAHAAELDVPAACARIEAPTLICHGGADPTVPAAEGEALHRSFSSGSSDSTARLIVVDGAGHTFGARHPFTDVPPDLERMFEETAAAFTEHLL